jgi:hypothetical protein
MFNVPKELNGLQLRAELRSAGVKISDDKDAVKVSDDQLILDINAKDNAKALEVVTNHVGLPGKSLTDEKAALLAKLGITEDEARLLLG